MKKESQFQRELRQEIEETFPGCIVLKNDAGYRQGIPDLLVLSEKGWAALEVKRSEGASHQPNQDYYVEKMNGMAFSRFIYPENKKEVLDELQQAWRS